MTEADDLELPAGARLIHIGPPKTGTTAIQRALHNARPALRDRGICYPGTVTRPRAAGWAVVGTGVPRGRPEPTMEDWQQLVDEVEDAGDQTVVVSNESFALGYDDAVRTIVSDLGGDRAEIVYVVRRVDKLLSSHWQQRVQAGLTESYEDWLRAVLGEPDQTNRHWRGFWRQHSLNDVLRRWSAAAGTDRVTLIIADESDPGLLPRLFGQLLGLPEGFLQLERNPSNRSMSLNEIEMLRQLHRLAADAGWSDQVFRRLIRFGVTSRLSRAERRPDDLRITPPPWAAKRAAELNDERIEAIRAFGGRVIGDPELLRSSSSIGDATSDASDVRVAPETAAEAIAGAIEAAERRHRATLVAASRAASRKSSAKEAGSAPRSGTARKATSPRRAVGDLSGRELVGELRARAVRRLRPKRGKSAS